MAALLWSVIIFILLTIPGKELPPGPEIPDLDKVIHIFIFGTQVWLWSVYCKHTGKFKSLLGIFFLIFLLSCLYGIGMEYYQKYFVANRAFELGDILADITGSAIAWLIVSVRNRRYKGV
ncbi:MAG: VanZ family protein [Agriterribacter sp.]